MIKIYTKLFSILIAAILLAGCGFTPYNAKSLPPQLHQIYFQGEHPYGQFETALKRKLRECGTVLVLSPKGPVPTLHLTSSYTYNSNNPASSVQARIYNLNYSASIAINDFNGNPLLPGQTVTVARSVTLQPNEVFETTPQVDIVKQEMAQELAIKVLNILSARRSFQALQNIPLATESLK